MFEDVYRDAAASTLAVVVALRGPRVGVEEVVQEAFARAFERWETVGVMARPDLWVQRVALNLATSRLRRLGAETRAVARLAGRRETAGDHGAVTEAFAQAAPFWDAVRRLPPKQGRVVALRYAGDLSVAEIAEVVDAAEGTVKSHLHAARARLRVLLDPPDDRRER